MRLEVTANVRHEVYVHPTNEELLMANAALSTALSTAASTVESLRSTVDSQSTVIAAGGDSTSISAVVSSAVDAEDTAVAGEIQSAVA